MTTSGGEPERPVLKDAVRRPTGVPVTAIGDEATLRESGGLLWTLGAFFVLALCLDLLTILWVQRYGGKETQEILTLLLAIGGLGVGAVSFVRYRFDPIPLFLYFSGLFFFLGLSDALSFFLSVLADPELSRLDPYMLWLSPRIVLAMFILVGWPLFGRKRDPRGTVVETATILVGIVGVLVTIFLIQSFRLPAFHVRPLERPLEAPFVLLFIGILFWLRRRARDQDIRTYFPWFFLFFGFQAVASAVMMFSATDHDVSFLLALLLRITAFVALPAGFVADMLSSFRQRDELLRNVILKEKQVEETEARLRGVMDAFPMGLMLVRMPEFRMEMINAWLRRFYGKDADAMDEIGEFQRRFQMQHRDGRPYATEEMPMMVAYREKRVVTSEDAVIVFPDGERRYLRTVSAPLSAKAGASDTVILIIEDITDRVRLEAKLADRENALMAAYDRVKLHEKEIVRLKDQFVFIAAHELRTPVNAIKWNIELLGEEKILRTKIPASARERLEDIGRATVTLLAIVEDLLNVSRLDYGTLKFEPTQVAAADAITDAVRLTLPLAKKSGIAVTVDAGTATLYADPRRVSEVLVNLLTNGIKYNRPGGRVTVSAREEGARTTVTVTDTGIGIAPEDIGKLFQRFFRVQDTETRDIEGTGLGLYIVKELTERMGGTITVQSAKGVGTSFILSLPRMPESRPAQV